MGSAPFFGLRCYDPRVAGTLPLLAVEVIDQREVFIFGPHSPDVRLHVVDPEFAKAMAEYFEQIWSAVGTKYELKALNEVQLNAAVELAIRGLTLA